MEAGVNQMRAPWGAVTGHKEAGGDSGVGCLDRTRLLHDVVSVMLSSEVGENVDYSRVVVETGVPGYDDIDKDEED